MTDQVIGVARIDIEASADSIEVATAKAKKSIASMTQDAQAQYQRLTGTEKRRIDSLLRQADTVGMTRAQQIAYNATLKSSGPILDDLTRRLKTSETTAKKAGNEFNKYGLTAKMELAALRQVPAQITDIVTSLQGGQKPLTVLIQQGGQLKDVFGGVVLAAKALSGAVIGMINPVTLAIGALAALAFGYLQGAKEGEEFRKTLIMTNGAIGVSAEGLQDLAAKIDGVAGTQANAAKVLNLFAGDAKVLASSLQQYAQTAIEWSDATGQGVGEIVEQFAALAKDPLKASEKLNESMRYLTAGTYEQIRALVEAGEQTKAATLAQSEYDRVLRERTPLMVENLGYVERAWRAIKNVSAEAMDSLLGIGRPTTLAQQLAEAQRDFAKNFGDDDDSTAYRGGYGSGARAAARQRIDDLQERMRLEGSSARQRQDIQREEQRQLALTKGRADYLKGGRSKVQQRDDDVAAENRKWKNLSSGLETGSKEYESLYEAHQVRMSTIDEKYRDKSGGPKNDAATHMLMSLREQEAALRAQLGSTVKLSSAQRDLAKFEQQIADIKTKQTLTADEKSILAAQDKLRAQLRTNAAVEREAEAKKAIFALEQRSVQIAEQMASARDNQNEQYQRMLDSFGLGDKAMEQIQAQKAIYKEFEKYQRQLTKAADIGLIGQDRLAEESSKIQVELQRRLAMQKSYYEEVDRLQSSWSLGASHGLANYADEASNAFKDMGSLATKSFQGMEDAFVGFVMTGKVSMTDLANSIISDLMRIAIRQSVMGPLAGALGGALGGLFGGTPMTSTPLGDVGTGGWFQYAKGGVHDSPSLSKFSNGIYDTPQTFKFAKGAGVFAEAGPEAIMPLKRGPDGTLGVQTHGQQSAPNVQLIIHNNGQPMQMSQPPKISMDSITGMVIEVFTGDTRVNGPMTRSMRGALGMQ